MQINIVKRKLLEEYEQNCIKTNKFTGFEAQLMFDIFRG
jgi:hypothetical protein